MRNSYVTNYVAMSPVTEAEVKQNKSLFTFMLQSVVFSTFSRSHWTASGVHEPTLTARSAKQHFTA